MEESIRNAIAIDNVRKMKSPIILMNSEDLKEFIKKIESELYNFKVGENPTYQNIPIKSHDYIEKGKFLVYDNDVDKLF